MRAKTPNALQLSHEQSSIPKRLGFFLEPLNMVTKNNDKKIAQLINYFYH